jgi:hypothetical protein
MPGEISRSYKGPKDGRVPTWMQDDNPVTWQFRFKRWGTEEWSGWSTLPDNWDGVRNPDYEYRPLFSK